MTRRSGEPDPDVGRTRAPVGRRGGPLQKGVSASGRVDELAGVLRNSRLAAAVETAAEVARRNPLPMMLMAVGAGWLVYSMGRARARNQFWQERMNRAERIPVLNTGHARIYDPDASPRHPTQDALESRREMSARV